VTKAGFQFQAFSSSGLTGNTIDEDGSFNAT
jgi:hypothetical protein